MENNMCAFELNGLSDPIFDSLKNINVDLMGDAKSDNKDTIFKSIYDITTGKGLAKDLPKKNK